MRWTLSRHEMLAGRDRAVPGGGCPASAPRARKKSPGLELESAVSRGSADRAQAARATARGRCGSGLAASGVPGKGNGDSARLWDWRAEEVELKSRSPAPGLSQKKPRVSLASAGRVSRARSLLSPPGGGGFGCDKRGLLRWPPPRASIPPASPRGEQLPLPPGGRLSGAAGGQPGAPSPSSRERMAGSTGRGQRGRFQVLVATLSVALVYSYNIDLEHPVIYQGPNNSFFGYSVLEHYYDNTRW